MRKCWEHQEHDWVSWSSMGILKLSEPFYKLAVLMYFRNKFSIRDKSKEKMNIHSGNVSCPSFTCNL